MQYPQNPLNSFFSPYFPKMNSSQPSFASLLQGFQSFGAMFQPPSPLPSEMLQPRVQQSAFEKFLQSQGPKPTNSMMNPFMFASPENPVFMNIFYDAYTKAIKEYFQKTPGPTENPNRTESPAKDTHEPPAQTMSLIPIKQEVPDKEEAKKDDAELLNASSTNASSSEPKEIIAEECIKEMLTFFAKHIGSVRRSFLEKEGEKMHHNHEDLKEVFNGLLKKLLSSRKTKEEKIKYVLRKCFKFMKDKLLEENGYTFESTEDYVEKLNSDKVEKMFFKHYFSERCGKTKKFLTKNEVTMIKDLSMPFRKNSQNKTMNIEFLKWIFSNEKFCSDYKLFLKNFNEVTSQDNVEKISKTAKKICELMETKNYKGFSQKYFKRMPWLDVGRIEAKEIALNLLELYCQDETKDEFLQSEEISLETLEPKTTKKIKTDDNTCI